MNEEMIESERDGERKEEMKFERMGVVFGE